MDVQQTSGEALAEGGFSLGGEQSGHIIFGEIATTGDGLLSAIVLADLVLRSGETLADLANNVMTRLPQVLINVRTTDTRAYRDDPGVSAAVAEADATLGSRGRVLLRPSGTEPVVRVMVESDQESLSRRCAESIAEAIRKAA